MKKFVLFLGLFMGMACAASSQEARFGIKAGVSLASVSGKNTEVAKNLLGATAGIMGDISFSDLISFHPEALFSQKGSKFEDARISSQTRTTYIDVPLLLRVKADGLFFEAGPQAGFLLGLKSESNIQGLGTSTSTKGTRKIDLGYIAGVGYQLHQGLELGVRYNGGISDLSDPSRSEKIRNSVFQFQVGYLFGGK